MDRTLRRSLPQSCSVSRCGLEKSRKVSSRVVLCKHGAHAMDHDYERYVLEVGIRAGFISGCKFGKNSNECTGKYKPNGPGDSFYATSTIVHLPVVSVCVPGR